MNDQWTERLSEYLDGDLAESDRAALEAHLDTCAACGETLAGLRRIVVRARSLEDRVPSRELWSGVAARIGAGPRRRRLTFSVPQLLAAGIALAVVSGGSAWLLHPDAARMAALRPDPASQVVIPVAATGSTAGAARSYASAVDDLERVLAEGRSRLDSTTVRVLEQNLTLIDRAIAQAQRAVAADSANLYLNTHLAETMRRKIDLLRQAAALVSAVS
ncbi:MAG: zf-HC2 domain-containing protein [Gemmatimonadales bacterium]|nr:zf-HC2 domain-containing protein [Gemmatimonadales bacterium]